jgi:hypothetical protein
MVNSTTTYRTNKASRDKHRRDNGKGGKYEHTAAYKARHYRARKQLGLKVGDKRDAAIMPNGAYKAQSLKINRGNNRPA